MIHAYSCRFNVDGGNSCGCGVIKRPAADQLQPPEGLRKILAEAIEKTTSMTAMRHEDLADVVLAAVARHLEHPDSPLCDCPRLENVPISPDTYAAMHHHCDCRAVETVAIMLGAYSKTEHAKQCIHGTEMDLHYVPPVSSTGEEPTGG